MKAQLLAFKKIIVIPHDNITGGNFQYNLDTDTGDVSYTYDIEGSIFFVPISYKGQGSVKVDPKLLVSANLKIGQEIVFGIFSLTVKSVSNGKATCDIKVVNSDISESGEALLDVSGQFVDLLTISANGTVKGFNEQIEAKTA